MRRIEIEPWRQKNYEGKERSSVRIALSRVYDAHKTCREEVMFEPILSWMSVIEIGAEGSVDGPGELAVSP